MKRPELNSIPHEYELLQIKGPKMLISHPTSVIVSSAIPQQMKPS